MTTGQRLMGFGAPRSRQEGHTAHATSEEARACAREMLDVYERCVRVRAIVCVCARLSDSLFSTIWWLMMAAHDAPFDH